MSDTLELDRLRAELQKQGKSQADVARLLGLDSSQVTRIFQGRRRIQVHEMRAIEDWLNIGAPPSGVVVAGPGMVPLYGWTDIADPDRLQLNDDFVLGYIAAHPSQQNLRNAFALQVPDDLNSPRYEQGETVYAAPHQRPAPGRWALVITKAGKAYVRRFLKRTAESLVLQQLNPLEELAIPSAEVASVHAIIGSAS